MLFSPSYGVFRINLIEITTFLFSLFKMASLKCKSSYRSAFSISFCYQPTVFSVFISKRRLLITTPCHSKYAWTDKENFEFVTSF